MICVHKLIATYWLCTDYYVLLNVLFSFLTDVDECAAGTDNCFQATTCTNTVGSFTCSCPIGYDLNANGQTCDGK